MMKLLLINVEFMIYVS